MDNVKLAQLYYALANKFHRGDYHVRNDQRFRIINAQTGISEHFADNGTLLDVPVRRLNYETRAVLEFLVEGDFPTIDGIQYADLCAVINKKLAEYKSRKAI